MSLPLYMDENVHGAITNGLRQRGIDVLTVQEDGKSGLPDPAVLDRAIALNRILFSQDDDLLAEANERQRAGTSLPGVVFARQTKVSIGTCIRAAVPNSKVRTFQIEKEGGLLMSKGSLKRNCYR